MALKASVGGLTPSVLLVGNLNIDMLEGED